MKRIIISTLILAVLSGCSIYRKYPRTAEADRNLYGKEYSSEDSTSIATLSWKELFTDTCLQRLIDTALVHNTDLGTARLHVEQAEAALLTARLSYLPSVNVGAEGGLAGWDGSTSKTYNINGAASWEIDIFGKITAAKREARASLEKSYAYRQAVQTSLVASVASTYYTLLMLDEQIIITEQTLQSWERTVSTLRSLMRAGKANDAAVLQAEANRATLEASLLSMRKSLKETENAMCLLLAQIPGSVERGKLAGQTFPDSVSIGIPVQLLANRPDVREAEMSLAKAFYATNVARAAFYPSVNLSGSAGWTNNGGGVVLNPGQWLLNAIGSLTQPLFNHGTNIANLKIAKAEQEIAALAFQQKLLAAGSEVNNALVALQTARERLAINSQSVVSLQEAVRKTELLMRHSSVNYLEVLTAQQSLLDVQKSLAQDKFDEIQGIISLYHALGGGQ
ncbi:efflux transporter outer membrane subunit [Alistipes sp. dk3620]|uniref:efflux transporter outer membrane subunit n=1 Tax=unclassified Alistipes TaxID=2608932 RepID=UPI0012951ED2|nr:MULTISPECIES: efflux transporter outer membrane subunit [unclassified Alistipes]MQX26782.1 efflux transporter outer membrane subunit [Alistipes sp. dk3620]QGA24175.1 efflux transporter outer membrane subunit [Alistipes sp. dk3624]